LVQRINLDHLSILNQFLSLFLKFIEYKTFDKIFSSQLYELSLFVGFKLNRRKLCWKD
jgi:hypothetical protein